MSPVSCSFGSRRFSHVVVLMGLFRPSFPCSGSCTVLLGRKSCVILVNFSCEPRCGLALICNTVLGSIYMDISMREDLALLYVVWHFVIFPLSGEWGVRDLCRESTMVLNQNKSSCH